jgi:tetratricopeptide (TPR) repeat protein
MSRVERAAIAAVIVLAVLAIHRLVWVPLRCDLETRALEESTVDALSRTDGTRMILARETLERAGKASAQCGEDLHLYMIRGANLRILRRSEEAEAMFREALRLNRRPEIYLQLGLAQVESGKNAEAVESFRKAVEFQPIIMEQVPVHLRAAVREGAGPPSFRP